MKNLNLLQKAKMICGNTLVYVAIIACVSFTAASCGKDEDDILGTEKPYDPKNPADAEMAAWLFGVWGYSDSNGSLDIDNMYEFKADGTFTKILSIGISGGRQATVFTGKYRLSGNQLTLYELLKGTGPATATHFSMIWYLKMDSYDTKDIPEEDVVYEIARMDEDTLRIHLGEGIFSDYNRGQ